MSEKVHACGCWMTVCDRCAKKLEAPEWISVKERLPEEGQRVLAWDGYKIYDCAHCGDVWIETVDDWSINTNDPVTHWMVLPEPPKEDE